VVFDSREGVKSAVVLDQEATMRLLVVISLLAGSLVYSQEQKSYPTKFAQCKHGNDGAEMESVKIDPCFMSTPRIKKRRACILQKGASSTITITFTATRDISSPVHSKVFGVLWNRPIKFTVIKRVCANVEEEKNKRGRTQRRRQGKEKGEEKKLVIKGGGPLKGHIVSKPLECPLKAGKKYTFQYKLPISIAYPPMRVMVKWTLVEANKKRPFLCVHMPTEIKSMS